VTKLVCDLVDNIVTVFAGCSACRHNSIIAPVTTGVNLWKMTLQSDGTPVTTG
jgi:hypothetical protein